MLFKVWLSYPVYSWCVHFLISCSVKQKPSEDQSDSVAAVKLVKPVVGPAAPVRQHQITAAELFTPTEVIKQ